MVNFALIYPHQLFRNSRLYDITDQIILIEDPLFFTQYPFHKKKLVFHRVTMKLFAERLLEAGLKVTYLNFKDFSRGFGDTLKETVEALSSSSHAESVVFHAIDPHDDWIKRNLLQSSEQIGATLRLYPSPSFLTDLEEGLDYLNKNAYFQTTFYIWQRRRFNLLLDSNKKPLGGKWSFDAENRAKWKGVPSLGVSFPEFCRNSRMDEIISEALDYVEASFSSNPGSLELSTSGSRNHIPFPVTPEETETLLKDFLENRLEHFGRYQDAIVPEEPFMFHSLLSPAMNVGLVTPQEVVDSLIFYTQNYQLPLNSVEGFLRQIVGWREFIRLIYERKGRFQRTCNFFNYTKKIPKSFWNGTTGIPPVDDSIRKVNQHAYLHHIERLMVIGNFFLLCQVNPDEVYEWFMSLFIDAYDWVMVPNVYGMSQYADGGLMTSKPYISGSNYIKNLSTYPDGKWAKIWDGLFWRFVRINRELFENNPRTRLMTKQLSRISTARMAELNGAAEGFLGLHF